MPEYTKRDEAGVAFIPDLQHSYGHPAAEYLALYEKSGLTPERVSELAEAEKEGLLLVMPPVQDGKIYVIETDGANIWVAERPLIYFDMRGVFYGFGSSLMKHDFESKGTIWFLSRAEAEAVLERSK